MSRSEKGRAGGKKVGASVRVSMTAVGFREAEEGCGVGAWRASVLTKVWVVSVAVSSEVR